MAQDTLLTTSPINKKRSHRRRVRRVHGVVTLALTPAVWVIVAVDVLLLVWMLLSSFKSTREMVLHPWSWPRHWLWSNYQVAWDSGEFGQGVFNSLALVIGAGVGSLVLAAPAAYALSRFGVRGSGAHIMFVVLGLGVPAQTMYIPLYVEFQRIGLVNSVLGLMLIYLGTSLPFSIFLLAAFFRSLPRELEEAATIDGASPWYVFWRVMLPLARSGLVTIFVLQAIGTWSETFFALVMLQTKTTVSLSLYNFMQGMQYTGSRYPVLFAGLIIVIVPVILLYIVLGRRIIEGITAGYGK